MDLVAGEEWVKLHLAVKRGHELSDPQYLFDVLEIEASTLLETLDEQVEALGLHEVYNELKAIHEMIGSLGERLKITGVKRT